MIRQAVSRWLGDPRLARLARPLLRRRATVFMLHRFAHPDRGPGLRGLECLLETLRRERVPIVGLSTLLDRWETDPRGLAGAVAFTVDDGYADFDTLGGPLFARFDAPVTVFLVTGFLDRQLWLWWDQVSWIAETTRNDLMVPIEHEPSLRIGGTTGGERRAAAAAVVERLKDLPDLGRRDAIGALAREAGVEIPAASPEQYAPMTWDQARSWSSRGVTFGPHTMSHPVLSRADPETSAREIRGSWERLRAEIPGAVPVFCYPNGRAADFGSREEQTVADLGLRAALATTTGYLGPGAARFALPRFALPSSLGGAVQIAFGVERAKALWRGTR